VSLGLLACNSSRPREQVFNKPYDPVAIRKAMTPAQAGPRQEGIALAIVLDTSGSMQETVPGENQRPTPKLQVARQALLELLEDMRAYTGKNPDTRILVGIYEFSHRLGLPPCRTVFPPGVPDIAVIREAVQKLVPEGTTPIGDAMILAKRDLDSTGMTRRHLLVITDGENTIGYLPGDVARVIAAEPEADRAGIYFVAFDVDAEAFDPVKEAGGLVLSAGNEKQLSEALDSIVTGRVFVSPPVEPAAPPHPAIKR
jgi:Mg-chelatase subunit ChlD